MDYEDIFGLHPDRWICNKIQLTLASLSVAVAKYLTLFGDRNGRQPCQLALILLRPKMDA